MPFVAIERGNMVARSKGITRHRTGLEGWLAEITSVPEATPLRAMHHEGSSQVRRPRSASRVVST